MCAPRNLISCLFDKLYLANEHQLWMRPLPGIYFPILWCSCTSDHRQEELAKFTEESRKFWESCYILATYCLNMVISGKLNSLKYGNFGVFFPQKFFVWNTGLLFLCQCGKNSPKKILDYMPTKGLLLTVDSLLSWPQSPPLIYDGISKRIEFW